MKKENVKHLEWVYNRMVNTMYIDEVDSYLSVKLATVKDLTWNILNKIL